MRIIRWVVGAAGGLLLLAAGALLVATLVINPNRYKGKVAAIVHDLSGRPLDIQGDLAVTWYPWLGVRTGAARLGNLPGASGPPLLEWSSIEVSARLVPLLHGQLVIDRIRLEQPRLQLRRGADGHGNWEDLLPGVTSAPGRPPPQVAGLDVRDGTLELSDEVSGVRARLDEWQLSLGAWKPGSPTPLSARFVVHGGSLPAAGVPVRIEAPEMTVRMAPHSVVIPNLLLTVADARVAGTANLVQTSEHTQAEGTVSAQVPSLRAMIAALGIETSLPRDPEALGPLTLTGRWTFADGTIALRPLNLRADATTFAGWIERSGGARPVWSFELHGDHIDLGRYVETEQPRRKPFELPVEALRALPVQGSLRFDRAQLAGAQLKDLRLRLQNGRP